MIENLEKDESQLVTANRKVAVEIERLFDCICNNEFHVHGRPWGIDCFVRQDSEINSNLLVAAPRRTKNEQAGEDHENDIFESRRLHHGFVFGAIVDVRSGPTDLDVVLATSGFFRASARMWPSREERVIPQRAAKVGAMSAGVTG